MFPFGTTGGRPASNYQIDRSLRFNDDDSAYLSRTPGSASNRKTWTWSGWVKRGNLGIQQHLFIQGADDNNLTLIRFLAGDTLQFAHDDGGSPTDSVVTTAVFRDPSAWYHIVVAVDTTQGTAADRIKMYVNGVQITAFGTANYPTLNFDTDVNTTAIAYIGRRHGGFYLDGYLAEIHFIDGTALDPTSFGEFDTNGVWRPIQVSGLTYGTNGFYLPFSDNTSTTTLGYDESGNNNDWTLNNFSVTAGAGNDSLEDTPTNNYCVLSPIDKNASATLSNGNLQYSVGTTGRLIRSTFGMTTGKWYWEINATSGSCLVGIADGAASLAQFLGSNANGWSYFSGTGNKYNSSNSAYGNTWTNGDVIGVALDLDNGVLWFSKNNTWQNSGDPTSGATATGAAFTGLTSGPYFPAVSDDAGGTATGSFNFGQRPFAYTPPSGFSALCTANLPTPDIADPSSYMNAVTYTGTGSSLAVTGVGFQPDLVWIKSRSAATDHALYDSTRGVQKQLESNTTTDETTEATGLTAFGVDGFTVGALAQVNTNTATYVGWCWKEGVTPGLDIVPFSFAAGGTQDVAHNLGTAPKFVILKSRTEGTAPWVVYHASLAATGYLRLNTTDAVALTATAWPSAPTSTVVKLGSGFTTAGYGTSGILYVFAEVEGFSKFGSYTGNGSTDGVFVYTGHRPRYILIKRSTVSTGSWIILDSKREGYNVDNDPLYAEATTVEGTTDLVDILSNGFKIRSTDASVNTSGSAYVFASFAEMPFSAPANAR